MPQKNWTAIGQLKDQSTKTAIALATDPELLACYQKGFPHLFVADGEDPGPRRIPLSVLREMAGQRGLEYYGVGGHGDEDVEGKEALLSIWTRFMCLQGPKDPPCPELSIPIVAQWPQRGTSHVDVPDEVADQLIGQDCTKGLIVTYQGRRCIVLLLDFCSFDALDAQMSFEEDRPDLSELILGDADFVNLEA